MPCTNFCSDHPIRIEVRVKQNFHRIWIAMEKPLVKRGPGSIMASVTACGPTAPSHYLNQWCSVDLGVISQRVPNNKLANRIFKIAAPSSSGQWINWPEHDIILMIVEPSLFICDIRRIRHPCINYTYKLTTRGHVFINPSGAASVLGHGYVIASKYRPWDVIIFSMP